MSKFKVGDKVKITGDTSGHGFSVGDIVEVSRVEGELGFSSVDERGTYWYVPDGDAVLVEESQPVKLNVGDPVVSRGSSGKSDGGPSDYYDFPEDSTTLNDLIEYKKMSFAQGNIFKAAYRMGNKDGISLEYDLKKIKYYADRMLKQLGG